MEVEELPADPPEWSPNGPFAAYEAQLASTAPELSDSGRWLRWHLLTIVAVAASLPALRAPAAWLFVCGAAAVGMLSSDSVLRQRDAQRRQAGSADVVVVPTRAVGRLALGLLNPVSWLTALLGAVVALVVGGVAAGVVAAVRWLALEGPDGIVAAIRMGVWAHGLTYAAAVACFLLLRAGGATATRRRNVLYRVTRRLSEPALTMCAVAVVLVGAMLAVAGPRFEVGFVRAHDGLGWLPPGLRTSVDAARDDVVREELDALTSCLSGDQSGLWTATYTEGNALTDDDVVTLVADPARAPDQAALATAALAADNQLAPWVEGLELRVGDTPVLHVVRRGQPHDQPLTDAAALRARTVDTPEWLATATPLVDRDRVLTCSARTPL
jgi:hypothetical protein